MRFKILEGLPPYGPMYVSINHTDPPSYSEGYVVRFFKNDGTDWVANFQPGWTDFNGVYDYADTDIIIVIARGQGYVMNPNETKAKDIFGLTIKSLLVGTDKSLICANDTDIIIVSKTGEVWYTERISWDGIKDLTLQNEIVTGLSFDPMNDENPWVPFQINIQTREIIGGSYRKYETQMTEQCKIQKPISRPWWKFW